MSPTVSFLIFLGLTLVGLGGVFLTGLRGQRRRHIPLVVVTVALLATTIYYAEQVGKKLDLESAGWIYPVHLWIAQATVAAYLLPVVSGIATLRNPARRKLHGKIAWLVLLLTILTAVTGTWMVALAAPAP